MKVCFKRCVRADPVVSLRDVWLSYQLDLPFVPPVGTEVIDGDWDCIVASLVYRNGQVFAFEEEDRPQSPRSDEEIEAITNASIEEGWQRSEGVLCV